MISVLGKRRVIVMAMLLLTLGGLGALQYLYMIPFLEDTDRKQRNISRQVSSVQNDITKLEVEFQQLEAQRDQYDILVQEGFFTDQNRRDATRALERIQSESGVISAVANVQPGEKLQHEAAREADHEILQSKVEIEIEALSDLSVFRYIHLLQDAFDGYLSFDSVVISRESNISSSILRGIASGQNPVLVTATLSLTWTTMLPIPEDDDERSQRGGR